MPEKPDRPFLTSPDSGWIWQGYLSFWDRALLGQIPYIQVERFAADWGIPPGLRPIRGGDFFGDISRLVNAVADFLGRGVDWIGDFLRELAGFPRDIHLWLATFFDQAIFPGFRAIADIPGRLWSIITGAPSWLSNAAAYAANIVWNGISWAASQVLGGITWAGNTIFSGFSWLGNTIYGGITWAAGQVYAGITWAGNTLWSGVTWAGNTLWSGVTWLGNTIWSGVSAAATTIWNGIVWSGTQVYTGITWLGNTLWDGITWATTHVWDGASGAFTWFWDTFLEPVPFDPNGHMSMWQSVLKPIDTVGDYFGSLPLVGVGRSPVARVILTILVGLAMLVTVPSNLATVYSMRVHQEAAKEAGAALMSQPQLREAYRRGIDTGDPVPGQLRRYGFDVAKTDAIIKLWDELPTPSALIRFGVREVFTPEIASTFGQYEDFPPEFGRWMLQVGFSDFWSKAYWAAHWELPSATQGFGMFHRGIISNNELELLLRALDVMPFWRDKLIQLNYDPIPWRALRLMYAAGTIQDEEVLKNLRFAGFNPDDSAAFLELFKKDVAQVGKDLPSSAILRLYSKRILTRADSEEALGDLSYNPDAINLLLDMEDLKLAEDLAQLQEEVIRHDYRAGVITAEAARSALSGLGVPAERIDLLVQLWTVEKAPRTVTLSASEVQRALHEKVISRAEAEARLVALGFNEADIAIKIALATPAPLPPEPPVLSVSQLQAAAKRGYLATFAHVRADLEEFVTDNVTTADEEKALRDQLAGRGYSDTDAWIITALAYPEPKTPAPEKAKSLTTAEVLKAFRTGLIDQNETVDRLRALGYSDPDIVILLEENLPKGA